jgi:hypothetical protein
MTATLTFLAPQTFDRACDRLQEAQANYTDAANALAETRCSLEFKRAELLEKGIDGKNAEAREATLRLRLFDEYTELLGLEVTLNEAKKDLEQARITWDCLRYKLRLLEVQKVLEGAA